MDIQKTKYETGRNAVWAAGFAGTLLLAGCTSTENTSAASSMSTAETSAPTTVPTLPSTGVEIVFDDLGGGSPDINVYQGVGPYDSDRTVSGTYVDGDTASATCVVKGRVVTSDPSVGELERSSDQWVRLAGSNVRQFATLVYAEQPEQIASQLPSCN